MTAIYYRVRSDLICFFRRPAQGTVRSEHLIVGRYARTQPEVDSTQAATQRIVPYLCAVTAAYDPSHGAAGGVHEAVCRNPVHGVQLCKAVLNLKATAEVLAADP